jgi:hypothetical protein
MGKPISPCSKAIGSFANRSDSQVKELLPNCRRWLRYNFNPGKAWQEHKEAYQRFYQLDSRDTTAVLKERQEIQRLKSELPPGDYVLVAVFNGEWYFTENSGVQC